ICGNLTAGGQGPATKPGTVTLIPRGNVPTVSGNPAVPVLRIGPAGGTSLRTRGSRVLCQVGSAASVVNPGIRGTDRTGRFRLGRLFPEVRGIPLASAPTPPVRSLC